MFFHRIDPRMSARRKVREWLVLLLRALLLLFLFLALMRPIWFGAGATGNVAIALIIDNSGSMSGTAGAERPKLKLAIEAAHALLGALKPKDSAALIPLVEDPAVPLPKGLVADVPTLRTALDHFAETEATGVPARALERAMELFETSTASQFEIHIFSDLQEDKWNKAPVETKRPRAGTSLFVHRIPTPPLREANISITGTKLPNKRILAGRRFVLEVELLNTSPSDGRVRLNWIDDLGNKNTLETALAKNEEKSVPILLEAPTPGFHWVNVWIEGDSFQADNRAGVGFAGTEKKAVLFCGPNEDFGLLPLAISPGGDGKMSGLVPVSVGLGALSSSLQEKKPVLAVLAWEGLVLNNAGLGELKNFVDLGGNLLLVPSASGSGAFGRKPDWLGVTLDKAESVSAGAPLLVFRKSAPIFSDLLDAKGELILRNLKAFKFQPLRLEDKENALAGLEDGRVVLAERKVGKGTVYLSGLALDSKASTLPLKGGFLALAQSLALVGGEGSDSVLQQVAGERLLNLPSGSKSLQIRSLAGSALDWKGEKADLPVFPRAGVYQVQTEKENFYVSVWSSDKEGHARFITGHKVPALGTLLYTVHNYSDGQSMLSGVHKLQRSLDLFLPLLVLACLCLAGEGWLANQPPRKAREPVHEP